MHKYTVLNEQKANKATGNVKHFCIDMQTTKQTANTQNFARIGKNLFWGIIREDDILKHHQATVKSNVLWHWI